MADIRNKIREHQLLWLDEVRRTWPGVLWGCQPHNRWGQTGEGLTQIDLEVGVKDRYGLVGDGWEGSRGQEGLNNRNLLSTSGWCCWTNNIHKSRLEVPRIISSSFWTFLHVCQYTRIVLLNVIIKGVVILPNLKVQSPQWTPLHMMSVLLWRHRNMTFNNPSNNDPLELHVKQGFLESPLSLKRWASYIVKRFKKIAITMHIFLTTRAATLGKSNVSHWLTQSIFRHPLFMLLTNYPI